jgi:hypothetical protein
MRENYFKEHRPAINLFNLIYFEKFGLKVYEYAKDLLEVHSDNIVTNKLY